MMATHLLGAVVVLLVALLGGWIWGATGHAGPDRAVRASELREDLSGAHTSVLGARVALYERNFGSASRQLEDARSLLRRAEERGRRLDRPAELTRLHLASLEADIDEAQRLLGRLDREADPVVPSP